MSMFGIKNAKKTPLTPEEKRNRRLGFLWIGIFIAFIGILSYFIGRPLIAFVSEPELFRTWVAEHGFMGKLMFIGMVALQVVVAIIPGEPLEIGAGYAYGPWQGMLLCLLGIALGSAIICLFVRRFGLKAVSAFFPIEKIRSVRFISDKSKLNQFVFLLFFIPGTPKDLLTYCVWLTPMKFGTYLLISSIARLPSVITSTIGGSAIAEKDYRYAIVIFAIAAILSLAGMLIYRRISNRKEKNDDTSIDGQP